MERDVCFANIVLEMILIIIFFIILNVLFFLKL